MCTEWVSCSVCYGDVSSLYGCQSFYPGASRSRESLRVLSMGSSPAGQNTAVQISQSTKGKFYRSNATSRCLFPTDLYVKCHSDFFHNISRQKFVKAADFSQFTKSFQLTVLSAQCLDLLKSFSNQKSILRQHDYWFGTSQCGSEIQKDFYIQMNTLIDFYIFQACLIMHHQKFLLNTIFWNSMKLKM